MDCGGLQLDRPAWHHLQVAVVSQRLAAETRSGSPRCLAGPACRNGAAAANCGDTSPGWTGLCPRRSRNDAAAVGCGDTCWGFGCIDTANESQRCRSRGLRRHRGVWPTQDGELGAAMVPQLALRRHKDFDSFHPEVQEPQWCRSPGLRRHRVVPCSRRGTVEPYWCRSSGLRSRSCSLMTFDAPLAMPQ